MAKKEKIYDVTTVYDVVYKAEKPLNKSMIGKIKKWYEVADLFEVISDWHVRFTLVTKMKTDKNPLDAVEHPAEQNRSNLEEYLKTISKYLEIKKETTFIL